MQWSPTEADVFASCSVDGTLRIWDTRRREGSAISIKAHSADINVISWNRCTLFLVILESNCLFADIFSSFPWVIERLRFLKSNFECFWMKFYWGSFVLSPSLQPICIVSDMVSCWLNRLASCMIASGCDDGTFRIWDLRTLKVICTLDERHDPF